MRIYVVKMKDFHAHFFLFESKMRKKEKKIFDNSYKQQSCHLKELEVKEQKKTFLLEAIMLHHNQR